MSTTNNGGPAFPTTDPNYEAKYAGEGMSLRDYFAAKAMQGLLACPMQPQSGPDMYAHDAYALADAMLKARGET
jgi:hypothetical protein